MADLDRAWKNVLFSQFHDILAGTSIEPAYEEARDQRGEASAIAAKTLNVAIAGRGFAGCGSSRVDRPSRHPRSFPAWRDGQRRLIRCMCGARSVRLRSHHPYSRGMDQAVLHVPSAAGVLEAAYRVHAAEIYRVVRAIVGNAATAEDITQDAFVRAYKKLHTYDASLPIKPWLVAIAVRIALDRVRRDRILRLLSLGASSGSSRAAEPESSELRIDMADALEVLTARERAVVVARHYVGMSYREIATALHITEGNTGVILHRAHLKLRAELSGLRSDE